MKEQPLCVSHACKSNAVKSEAGYILIAVLFAVALMVVAMAAVAPAIGTQIQRDREEELVRRGKQYARAIQLYFRKFGRYPNSIEQLENTNNIRFLRKRFRDPITGKEEWKLVRFGFARVKQRPAYLRGATPAGNLGGTGLSGTTATQIPGAVNAQDISKPLSGSSPTIGGGPIVGVASTSKKDGLKEMDGSSKYEEWEFTYDPRFDPNARQQPVQQGRPGQPSQPGPTQLPVNPPKPN